MGKNMKQRIISGVIIAVLIVAFGFVGGPALAAFIGICSMIGYYELVKAAGVLQKKERMNAPVLIGLIGAAAYYAALIGAEVLSADAVEMMRSMDFITIVTVVAVFLVSMTCYVLTFPKYTAEPIMKAQFCFLYAPILMAFVYRSRMLTLGILMYALIFVCSSVCDVCALAAGMLLGKHKMAPVLSPKKTIEGAVGGVIGATIGAFICALIANKLDPSANVTAQFVAIGIVGSFISMIGDLAASAIKRNHKIKDYGKLIPGHGGIMDRFDSIIFVSPVIYLIAVIFIA